MLTQQRLKELLAYDPETGVFRWLVDARHGKVKAGDVAGCLDGYGYRIIKIDRKPYKAHRLAWLYVTGAWPSHHLDHKNRVQSDCSWLNLREATYSQNRINIARGTGRSGLRGAAWSENEQKWKSSVSLLGNCIHLGYFDDANSAHEAYREASRALHGEWSAQ